jgi:tetratricopeptide (TPR) repeat protein
VSVDKTLRRAKSLAKSGDFLAAKRLYQDVVASFPSNQRAVDGLHELENPTPLPPQDGPTEEQFRELARLFDEGRYTDLVAMGKPLAGRFPGFAMLQSLLGGTYVQLDMKDEAVDMLSRAIRLNPRDPYSRNAIGSLYAKMNRSEAAIENLREAIKLNPAYAEAHVNLALALSHAGRSEEALAAIGEGLRLQPNDGSAYRHLSLMKRFAADDPEIDKMRRLLKSVPPNSRNAVQLHFALGKAHDDFGDPETAFEHFAAGNRIHREQLGDVIGHNRDLFDRIKAAFRYGNPGPVKANALKPSPHRMIFVVGMPRSGTTLVEQILSSHSSVFGAGELEYVTPGAMEFIDGGGSKRDGERLAALSNGYMQAIDRLDIPEPVIVDKMPLNFRWTGFILSAFPDATIIHTRRDPVAVCWSNFRIYFPAAGMNFTWDLKDLGEYYRLYEDLMAFWHERFPGRITDLDYDTLTENQETETRRLLSACGLEFEDACLRFHENKRAVNTASLDQVRQPIYRGSSQEWRKYEKHLAPLVAALGDSARDTD